MVFKSLLFFISVSKVSAAALLLAAATLSMVRGSGWGYLDQETASSSCGVLQGLALGSALVC